MTNILASATKSATYNIIFQVLMRAVTFILNAFILRYIDKDVLGIINVRLLLLYSTIQFISREAFRRACLSENNEKYLQKKINILWIIVPTATLCGLILGYIWSNFLILPDPEITMEYHIGVTSVVIAVIIEALAEPIFVMMQILLFVKLRVFIEGISLLVRSLLLIITIQWYPKNAIVDFSFAIISGALVYTLSYYSYLFYVIWYKKPKDFTINKVSAILPARLENNKWFDKDILDLMMSFFKQGLLKQFLTEGEKYLMTIFGILTFAEQGIYDVVNNLGSIAARFIFAPVEESSYLFFTHVIPRGIPAKDLIAKEKNPVLAASVLENILKIMCLFGITVLSFGYIYSPLLLHIYGGAKLSYGIGPILLRCHCMYVVLIAINGVSEAFVFACMNQEQVNKYNAKMVIFSISFIVLSLLLTNWLGSAGFIFANCGNMILRILHSIFYIIVYYKGTNLQPLNGIKISIPVILTYFLCFLLLITYQRNFEPSYELGSSLMFVSFGLICLLICTIVIYLYERSLFQFLYLQWKQQREKAQ